MKTGGIILCGGRSHRMGLPKATLPFGDETMLGRVCRLLGEVIDPLIVVAAPRQDLPHLPDHIQVVRDRSEGRGPLEGLAVGLRAMRGQAEAAYVTSCDVPLLVQGFVRHLINTLGEHQIAVPRDGKYHHPLAAVYRTNVVGQIERLLAADRMRPVFLFEDVDTFEVPTAALQTVDPDLQTLRNLNRPQDYVDALQQAGFTPSPDILAKLNQARRSADRASKAPKPSNPRREGPG